MLACDDMKINKKEPHNYSQYSDFAIHLCIQVATETGSCDVEAASSEDDEYLPEYNVTKGKAQGSSPKLFTPIAVVTNPSNPISTQTTFNTSAGHQPSKLSLPLVHALVTNLISHLCSCIKIIIVNYFMFLPQAALTSVGYPANQTMK